MRNIFFTFLVCACFSMINSLSAQVFDVEYLIEFNSATGHYDCKIVIIDGQATATADRIQFSSSYTIVVPSGSQFSLEQNFAPFVGNIVSGTSTTPANWFMSGSSLAPPIQPQNDFYNIVPNISPTAFYDNVSQGDVISLFSFSSDAPCEDVRPFINGVDPNSTQLPGSIDLSNGFVVGVPGLQSVYSGNQTNNSCFVLPVTFIDFDARLENETIHLSWEVEDEINLSHYEIEISEDGKNFSPLDKKNADNSHFYELIVPLEYRGEQFFRLSSIDLDGTKEYYSKNISVSVLRNNIKLAPNPVSNGNDIMILMEDGVELNVEIYSIDGSKILARNFGKKDSKILSLRDVNLMPGLYIATFQLNGNRTIERFVVE